MKSYREQLVSVQKAIEVAQDSQESEIEVNGNKRKRRMANIESLYKRESYLMRMIEREEGHGIVEGVPSDL